MISGTDLDVDVVLIGCGKMGIDYAHVLNKLALTFVAIGRSVSGVDNFKSVTGQEARAGGLKNFLHARHCFLKAVAVIVCVPNAQVPEVIDLLISAQQSGQIEISKLLLEKSLATHPVEALKIIERIEDANIKFFVAFNRRFYPVVQHLKKIIQEHGGVEYVHFEFNEWDERFDNAVSKSLVCREDSHNWEFVTSCHVIDMAFYLAGGMPIDVSCTCTRGNIPPITYHPRSAAFGGHATTSSGTLLTWKSYYRLKAPWMVEIVTSKRVKFRLNPIEKLFRIDSPESACEVFVPPEDKFEGLRFGLGEMVDVFLSDESDSGLAIHGGLVGPTEYKIFLERVYAKITSPPRSSVVIIGGGQIAHRYIQGFQHTSSGAPFVYVSEPSKSQQRILCSKLAVHDPSMLERVSCAQQPSKWFLPRRANLLLSATGAEHRFDSTLEILHKMDDIDVLLLEKPSFQRLEDFDAFLELTNARGLNVFSTMGGFVVHSKFFSLIQKLSHANPDSIVKMRVTGVNWGMCCNSGHYFAMFAVANGMRDGLPFGPNGFRLDTSFDRIKPAKRSRCFEVGAGTIKLVHEANNDTVLELQCAEGDSEENNWLTISFDSPGMSAHYRIGDTSAVLVVDDKPRTVMMDVKFTSQAAPLILEHVLEGGKIQNYLTLKAVSSFEKHLLAAFGEHFRANGIDTEHGVPIS